MRVVDTHVQTDPKPLESIIRDTSQLMERKQGQNIQQVDPGLVTCSQQSLRQPFGLITCRLSTSKSSKLENTRMPRGPGSEPEALDSGGTLEENGAFEADADVAPTLTQLAFGNSHIRLSRP